MAPIHIPILVKPIIEALIEPFLKLPQDSEPHWLVDCTFGGGGHCAFFLEEFKTRPELRKHKILALDQDTNAILKGCECFRQEIQEGRLEIIQSRFGDAGPLVKSRPVLGLMADLGFSSDQLEDSSRGLSFQSQGPLDMRLDPTRGMSCVEFLRQISESELERVLSEYGEERFSRRIASAILSRRRLGQLPCTTQELVDTVVRAIPASARHGRIHVSTRTFQALRIAVNDELGELDSLLNEVVLIVEKGGRVAVLSFHSLEDRKVKYSFKEKGYFLPITKKPIQASEEEIRNNPRARSAKLRIAERVGQEEVLK